MKAKADEFLDTTQSYSKQSLAEINKICGLVRTFVFPINYFKFIIFFYQTTKRFPIVDKYENHWPVRDILKLHLKYTSEIYRKQPSKVKKASKVKGPGHSKKICNFKLVTCTYKIRYLDIVIYARQPGLGILTIIVDRVIIKTKVS